MNNIKQHHGPCQGIILGYMVRVLPEIESPDPVSDKKKL